MFLYTTIPKCAIPPLLSPYEALVLTASILPGEGVKRPADPPSPCSPAGTIRQPCPRLGAGACPLINDLWECRHPAAQQDSIQKDRPLRTVLGPSHFNSFHPPAEGCISEISILFPPRTIIFLSVVFPFPTTMWSGGGIDTSPPPCPRGLRESTGVVLFFRFYYCWDSLSRASPSGRSSSCSFRL